MGKINLKKNAEKTSDKVERKVFNILRNVPLVGQVYGIIRSGVYKSKGDIQEARRSLTFDLDNLNPIRMSSNIGRNLAYAFLDENKGIWIGRRPLSNQPFGLSLIPGTDLYHWAVIIRGKMYQISVYNKTDKIIVLTNNAAMNSFTWNGMAPENSAIIKSDDEIKNYAISKYHGSDYQLLRNNCQVFVIDIITFAMGISRDKAESQISVLVGTILF